MTIEERFEIMEKELGRMKRRNRWLFGAILLLATGLAIPPVFETTAFRARAQVKGTVKEIRAKKIVIEDEAGKTRAEMWADKGSSSLALYD
jgi:hypothetical protein